MSGRDWTRDGFYAGDEQEPQGPPVTATDAARRAARVRAYEGDTFWGSEAELDGRTRASARKPICEDEWLEELAAAFWHGEEPTVRRSHPDIVAPVDAVTPANMQDSGWRDRKERAERQRVARGVKRQRAAENTVDTDSVRK